MKSRLFWKILIGFVVTFIAITMGVWFVLQFYGGPPEPFNIGYLKNTAPGYLETAAKVAQKDGVAGVQQTIANWPKTEKKRLKIELGRDGDSISVVRHPEITSPDWLPSMIEHPVLDRVVNGPSGEAIRLTYDVSDIIPDLPSGPRFRVPNPLLVLGAVGAIIFSAGLAWYLTRPILKISAGFEQLSQGNLDYRLGDAIGQRRDEITDLARDFDVMADRLQRLVAARDRLLNDVSHELRSPLARMQLAVGLARQKPDKSEASLDRIEKETVRLDELVGQLLTLSRVESGAAHQQTWIDFDHLLGRVVSDARFEAEATGVVVEAEFGDRSPQYGKVPVLSGSPELLRRAFENILRNALRHSEEGQVVHIRSVDDVEQGRLVVTITDQGPGIDDQKLEDLFEPFVRGAAHAWGGGFGLGLSIAQRAIRAHGGDIKIENRDEGGLRVLIWLPYQLREAEI